VSTPADSLQDRYGRAPASSRLVVAVVVGVLVVTALAWLAWATLRSSDPAVSSSEVSKDEINAHQVWITYQIKYGDGPVDATCSARAIASDGEEVGRTSFAPSRLAQPDQTFRATFRTTRMADSIEWLGCTAPGQPRPH
jgi:hypothetical protein